MKLHTLALDYDGTIADHDVMVPGIAEALQDLRKHGARVVLVTGRRLADLRRLPTDLCVFDVVVAENGGVLLFPDTGRTQVLAPAPSARFVDQLRSAGVPIDVGQCVVETDAAHAVSVLQAIQAQELPLAIVFNRGRLMILPQDVSKATGLHAALRALRLSEHNTLAIGDAENDHALLTASEVGVAVSWGSPALRAIADEVLQGSGPEAVVPYLHKLAQDPRVEVPHPYRRRMFIGTSDDGYPVTLGVHGRNILIAGDPRSGKSWMAGLLAEQRILHGYCLCVIDPEGDYLDLQSLPGTLVLGSDGPPPRPHEIADALRHPDISVVIDLCKHDDRVKQAYIRGLLPVLAALRRRTGLPHRIVLDEAHYWLREPDAEMLFDLDESGYTLITYHLSEMPQRLLSAFSTIVLTRTTMPAEIGAAAAIGARSPRSVDWATRLGALSTGEVLMMPIPGERRAYPRRVRLAPRVTSHVRHRHKYVDVPVAEPLAFVFTRSGVPLGRPARTLNEFCAVLERCEPEVFKHHLNNGDFERWVADVYGDRALAGMLHELAHRPATGDTRARRDTLIELIRGRYLIETR